MRMTTFLLSTLALTFSTWAAPFAAERAAIVQSLDVLVPQAPVTVNIAGRPHLVYELHITNLRAVDVALTRVDVLDNERATAPLAELRDSALSRALERVGGVSNSAETGLIGAGVRAVLYLWLPLDATAPAPAQVVHRIEFDIVRPTGRERASMRTAVLTVDNTPPLVLSPPLRGGRWVGLYDPAMSRGHRRALYTLAGRTRIPARFAIDWVRIDDDGQRAHGDRGQIVNWYGYGTDVLAVADAVVVEALDDIAEDPVIAERPAAVALENASGNTITLGLGRGRYAFYEHLKHGSLSVKPGDRVRKGQTLAQLGNSGSSSSGPHLHFHVGNGFPALEAEGVPYVFTSFELLGTFDAIRDVDGAARPLPAGMQSRRRLELPAPNSEVRF